MKEIPLTQGKIALVDDDDYKKLSQFKWYNYAGHVGRVKIVNSKSTTVLMHREIMNAPPGTHIKHIDGDKYNNQKCNLRLVRKISVVKHRDYTILLSEEKGKSVIIRMRLPTLMYLDLLSKSTLMKLHPPELARVAIARGLISLDIAPIDKKHRCPNCGEIEG